MLLPVLLLDFEGKARAQDSLHKHGEVKKWIMYPYLHFYVLTSKTAHSSNSMLIKTTEQRLQDWTEPIFQYFWKSSVSIFLKWSRPYLEPTITKQKHLSPHPRAGSENSFLAVVVLFLFLPVLHLICVNLKTVSQTFILTAGSAKKATPIMLNAAPNMRPFHVLGTLSP